MAQAIHSKNTVICLNYSLYNIQLSIHTIFIQDLSSIQQISYKCFDLWQYANIKCYWIEVQRWYLLFSYAVGLFIAYARKKVPYTWRDIFVCAQLPSTSFTIFLFPGKKLLTPQKDFKLNFKEA